MTQEKPPIITRRQILAGLSAVGIGGVATGFGINAMLSDTERFPTTLTAGAVDLVVTSAADSVFVAPDGTFGIDAGTVEPGLEYSVPVTFSLPTDSVQNNPAYLWLRALCPDPANALAEALQVQLVYEEGNLPIDGLPDGKVPLTDLAELLAQGVALDTDPGSDEFDPLVPDGTLTLLIRYRLAAGYTGSESTTVRFHALAVQARHNDDPLNPFAGLPPLDCGRTGIEELCECCGLVGKLDLTGDNRLPAPETDATGEFYRLTETCLDGDLRLYVAGTTTKDGGAVDSLTVDRLTRDGTPLTLCEVYVKPSDADDTTEGGPFCERTPVGVHYTDADGPLEGRALTAASGKSISNVTFLACLAGPDCLVEATATTTTTAEPTSTTATTEQTTTQQTTTKSADGADGGSQQ